ncbi:MAG: exo-beta-N-acetylmuramidase NamZ family protein, partial [Chitinophagales bacterium]
HYVMEACAENNIPLLVLDRPNPNGHYVDGPVLEKEYQSFVGMHPIPVVHGMTIGEYAQMINGEKWLKDGIQCDLSIINCQNYDHNTAYEVPIKPSPNLPNAQSISLYPSICFFEGTEISLGRGTNKPFQVMGNPDIDEKLSEYTFTPVSTSGAKYPKHENTKCFGFNLEEESTKDQLDLSYLITMYNLYPKKDVFFLKNGFFENLAGTKSLREAIIKGMSEEEIRKTWQDDLELFKKTRQQYLLYKDFE